LRREVHNPPQDPRCCPRPSPTDNRLGSSSSTKRWTGVTTLHASLHVADPPLAPSRSAPDLSTTHRDITTDDLGVSPDPTHTDTRCPQLLARLPHNNLPIAITPKLLDAPPERRHRDVRARGHSALMASPIRGGPTTRYATSARCSNAPTRVLRQFGARPHLAQAARCAGCLVDVCLWSTPRSPLAIRP
jgi:hypothetical protein